MSKAYSWYLASRASNWWWQSSTSWFIASWCLQVLSCHKALTYPVKRCGRNTTAQNHININVNCIPLGAPATMGAPMMKDKCGTRRIQVQGKKILQNLASLRHLRTCRSFQNPSLRMSNSCCQCVNVIPARASSSGTALRLWDQRTEGSNKVGTHDQMISLIDSLLRNDVLGAFVGSKVAARWYLVVVWFIHSLMIRFCCISSLSHCDLLNAVHNN